MKLSSIFAILSLTLLSSVVLHAKDLKKGYLKPAIDSRVLSGEEAIKHMHIADGFQINLFAEEPHVINPVVMRFDELGRLWVVEMIGYMNNLRGTKELDKIGRISILIDANQDGKMDESIVFLDKLIEPRALAFHKNGLLWADTAKLYFTEIVDDKKAGKTIVVDETYAHGHSVEHKPNALLRAIDNWYYSAKSHKRYKEINGKWVIEHSEYRGQFGLGMDDHGRLYHGQQNTLLRADIFSPNFFRRNVGINVRAGGLSTHFNEVKDYCYNVKVGQEAVFPVRYSRDIRDGYPASDSRDVDEEGYAFRCTSACSHFIYRDTYFPSHFNAFIADPALHFVKVFTLERKHGIPSGKNTFANEEIVASPDTRFRPVDVQSAPDGSIYIADMYHGILQHKAFMNQHLWDFVKKNKLEGNGKYGRIYRLTVKDKKVNTWKPLAKNPADILISSFDSRNPWVRDTAQRILVDRGDLAIKGMLDQYIFASRSSIGRIHALWTMEGLGLLDETVLMRVLDLNDESLNIHVCRLSWRLKVSEKFILKLLKVLPKEFNESSYYILQRLANLNHQKAQKQVAQSYLKWKDQPFMLKVLLSGSGRDQKGWIESLPEGPIKNHVKRVHHQLTYVPKKKPVAFHLKGNDKKKFDRGKVVYKKSCFSCHGNEGEGIKDMGPPLAKSEWVTEKPERLIKILLKGLQGEIKVKGVTYKPKAAMPAFEGLMTDAELSDVITYIRNTWGNKSKVISETEITKIRNEIKAIKMPYHAKDLQSK